MDVHPARRIILLPWIVAMSCVANVMEIVGKYWTMVAPEAMREWAESV